MSTLGNRLRECRKESGYKQKEVCARTGLKQGTLSELENDKYPTSSFIPHLAKIYGVEAMWLATGKGPKTLKDAKAYTLSEAAMKIAIAVSEMPPEQQDAILHMITVFQIKEQAKSITQQQPLSLT